MLLSLVAIMVFFQFMTDGTLLQPLNLTNLVLQNSYIVIMALGMLLVIVAGHIDLSVGSVVGFIGALAAVLMVQFEMALRAGHAALPGRGCGDRRACRAGSSPSSRSRRSSSRWPACWCSRAWRWRCCRASRSGRFRRRSSCSARASSPTGFDGETLRTTSLLIGARWSRWRWWWPSCATARASMQHGMEDEPDAVLRRQERGVRRADRRLLATCWRRTRACRTC